MARYSFIDKLYSSSENLRHWMQSPPVVARAVKAIKRSKRLAKVAPKWLQQLAKE